MARLRSFLAAGVAVCSACVAHAAEGFTAVPVPSVGVYRFTFGVAETSDGSIPVPASAVCDVNGTYTETFSYGFTNRYWSYYNYDASGNTWQVGENGPCSSVYPFEAWTATVLDNDCTGAARSVK